MQFRRFLMLCLCFPLFVLVAYASGKIPDSPQYGKVMFSDDFESYTDGSDILISSPSPAYVSSEFTSKYGTVRLVGHGDLYAVTRADGNQVLQIAKKTVSTRWPRSLSVRQARCQMVSIRFSIQLLYRPIMPVFPVRLSALI